MKYGDTLRQRSIPEWALRTPSLPIPSPTRLTSSDNIDYDQLKDLIKHQTTSGGGKAVSIPGQGASTERAFGDDFYNALKEQHHRINRFIRSKSGEIDRRLAHISSSLQHVQSRQPGTGPGGKLPVRIVEQYAKIDADVAK